MALSKTWVTKTWRQTTICEVFVIITRLALNDRKSPFTHIVSPVLGVLKWMKIDLCWTIERLDIYLRYRCRGRCLWDRAMFTGSQDIIDVKIRHKFPRSPREGRLMRKISDFVILL